MDKQSSSSGGIGFTGLLTVAFIVLKLCKVINWSWWWVLSPIWIMVAIFLISLLTIYLITVREQSKEIRKMANTKSKWQERMDKMKADQQRLKRESEK